MKANGNRPGFTVIELIEAIVIAAVLMAIAIPNFESLVNGSSSNRATLEFIGALQKARLKAIKTHQPVTVTFNQPAANQFTMTWTENGARSLVYRLSSRNTSRVTFDNNPPDASPAPDDSFVFTNLGFIQPSLGGAIGNIYLIDNTNGRRFNIATTAAGTIVERRWDGSAWSGPQLSI